MVVAEVPVPLTEFPFEARTSATSSVLAASPTKMEMMIAAASLGSTDLVDGATVAAQQHANEESDAARGPGDGWPPLKFIWVAYIPEAKFAMAVTPQPDGPSPPTPYPYLITGGDGHGSYQPNASNRFRQELTFYFGSSHTIVYGETMGQSHLWQCNVSNGTDCINHSSGYASLTQLSATWSSGTTSGTAHVAAAAAMPLIPFAPPINTDWTIKLSTGGSSIVGTHDNMPQHKIYAGIYPGHADRIYQGAYYGANARGLACLVPFGPACTTRFNLTL